MERPDFITCDRYRLFSVLHTPENGSAPLFPHKIGVVFCHPFAEEKLIAHRAMVNVARKLAEVGIYSLRFDHRGHGDSDGSFEDATVETIVADIRCSVDFIRRSANVEKVGLLGLRFGGTLAAVACRDDLSLDFMIAVAPILDGKAYIEQCLRSNLTTQLATYGKVIKDRKQLVDDLMSGTPVNVDGYLVSSDLYQQIAEIDLLNQKIAWPGKVLLVQVVKDEKQADDRGYDQLRARIHSASAAVEQIKVVEDQFWKDVQVYSDHKRRLETELVRWFQRNILRG